MTVAHAQSGFDRVDFAVDQEEMSGAGVRRANVHNGASVCQDAFSSPTQTRTNRFSSAPLPGRWHIRDASKVKVVAF